MNRRVLHVDDQPTFREGLRQLLHGRFELVSAASGAEALALCERDGPFAAVVSDYGMPGMTGIELLRELAERWPDTGRILLTGCADPGLALEALDQGAIHRFLTKPPLPARLIEAVAEAVERFHTAAEERLLTEQLAFARESLSVLVQTLDGRLADEQARLEALGRNAERLSAARSIDDVLARTGTAVRELLGAHSAEVHVSRGAADLEIVPVDDLPGAQRRALAILACSARGALANTLRRERAKEAQRATLLALERVTRHRDGETGEHLARVSLYARLLAEGLRADGHELDEITDEFLEDIAVAAPLHDVGKVAVPDAILLKPGKLDEREWEVMRTHAERGAEILRGIHPGPERAELLELARTIAWTHHERWDGTGYPRHLAREDIPLAGRILALADCYDALTSVRPYKPAWPHHAAVAHVREQRGLAFDPRVADAFLAREHLFDAIRNAPQGAGRGE